MSGVGVTTLLRPVARLLFGRSPAGAAELAAALRDADTIAVAALSGIGDAVMATPLLQAVAEARPDARILVLVRPDIAPLLPIDGSRHRVLPVKLSDRSSLLGALRALRRMRPALFLAAQPFNTLKHSLLAIASGSRYRLKNARDYAGEQWRDFGFLYSALPADTPGRHRVELDLDLLRALGAAIPEGSIRPRLRVPEEARRAAGGLLERPEGARLLAVHPGGLYAHKQWGAERFAEACRLLAADPSIRFVMLGAGPELDICRSIVRDTPGISWIDLSGRTDLATTAAVLEVVDLLLSNDTGVMHLATAVDLPVVALYGQTDPARIGPYHAEARWIRRDPITAIAPGEVAALVADSLARIASAPSA